MVSELLKSFTYFRMTRYLLLVIIKTVFSVFTIRPVENRMSSFDIGNKTRKTHRENCPHDKRKTHQPEMNTSWLS